MKQLFLIFPLLMLCPATQARLISGKLQIKRDQTFLWETSTNQKYHVKPTRVETIQALAKLQSGDTIEGQGDLSGSELTLDSIEFVGLSKIFGLWKSDNSSIYDFRDSNVLIIYRKDRSQVEQKASKLEYTLSPTEGATWRVFINDGDSILPAMMSLTSGRMSLEFFDSQTGAVSSILELTKKKTKD